jgi:rhodanese-related sulfurtransferase
VVNCKTGGRARFAASILLKHGIHPVVLNEQFDNIKQKGFKIAAYVPSDPKDGACCEIF